MWLPKLGRIGQRSYEREVLRTPTSFQQEMVLVTQFWEALREILSEANI